MPLWSLGELSLTSWPLVQMTVTAQFVWKSSSVASSVVDVLVSPFHDSIQSGLFGKFSSLALKPFQCQPCSFCSGQLYCHLWAGSGPGTEDKPQVSLQSLPVVVSPFWAWEVGADNFVSKLACSQEYVLFVGWVQIIAFALLLSRRHLYSLTCLSSIVFVME